MEGVNARKDHCYECYPWKYPEELRERATRMAVQGPAGTRRGLGGDPQDRPRRWAPRPEALRTWVKKAEIDAGTRPGITSEEAQRIRELEAENRELRRANAIPKECVGFFRGRCQTARTADLREASTPAQAGAAGPARALRSSRAGACDARRTMERLMRTISRWPRP